MSEIMIRAMERNEKPKIARRKGFAPGVIYGEGYESSLPVKFEMDRLKKILKKHGESAKIWVKIGEERKYGVIKDVQKDPIRGEILHIDIQIIARDKRVKLKLPIVFNGRSMLSDKKLTLQVFISELEVMGDIDTLPQFISINTGCLEAGKKVTVEDIDLGKDIRILNDSKEVIAAAIVPKELTVAS